MHALRLPNSPHPRQPSQGACKHGAGHPHPPPPSTYTQAQASSLTSFPPSGLGAPLSSLAPGLLVWMRPAGDERAVEAQHSCHTVAACLVCGSVSSKYPAGGCQLPPGTPSPVPIGSPGDHPSGRPTQAALGPCPPHPKAWMLRRDLPRPPPPLPTGTFFRVQFARFARPMRTDNLGRLLGHGVGGVVHSADCSPALGQSAAPRPSSFFSS